MFPCLSTKISAVLMQCSLLKYVSKLFKCQQWVCGRQAGVAVAWTIGVLPARPQQATPCLLLACPALQSVVVHIEKRRGGYRRQEWKDRCKNRGKIDRRKSRKCCGSFSLDCPDASVAIPASFLLSLMFPSVHGDMLSESVLYTCHCPG